MVFLPITFWRSVRSPDNGRPPDPTLMFIHLFGIRSEPAEDAFCGKIMRRILRKIAEDSFDNLGDTSTLADPAVVDDLIDNRQNRG